MVAAGEGRGEKPPHLIQGTVKTASRLFLARRLFGKRTARRLPFYCCVGKGPFRLRSSLFLACVGRGKGAAPHCSCPPKKTELHRESPAPCHCVCDLGPLSLQKAREDRRRHQEARVGRVHDSPRPEPPVARQQHRLHHRLAQKEVTHPLGDDDRWSRHEGGVEVYRRRAAVRLAVGRRYGGSVAAAGRRSWRGRRDACAGPCVRAAERRRVGMHARTACVRTFSIRSRTTVTTSERPCDSTSVSMCVPIDEASTAYTRRAPAMAAQMASTPVPEPTSRTVLPLKWTAALYLMALRGTGRDAGAWSGLRPRLWAAGHLQHADVVVQLRVLREVVVGGQPIRGRSACGGDHLCCGAATGQRGTKQCSGSDRMPHPASRHGGRLQVYF
eukprot:scaffold4219_cov103-Isochrysis_galbana.AAC.1